MDEMIEVVVNGKTKIWPKREYLDYKAYCLGFEDYDDLIAQGYKLSV